MFELDDQAIKALQDNLLAWFQEVARPLPWRRDRTLYGTWIAETMLQQTTVAVVEDYWHRFLARFPSVQELSRAEEHEVLSMWSGLGYYRRARHLHQAARQIMAQGGELPGSQADWAALPGVGPYASGAIASQALGERVPALDANAKRVLTRWLVAQPEQLDYFKPRELVHWAGRLVPATVPGPWNEAVMELGALVCGARQAQCTACPVLDHCRAGLAGTADLIPRPVRRESSVPVEACLLILKEGQGLWLVTATGTADLQLTGPSVQPLRSDFSGLHHGMLGLPTTVWYHPPETPVQVALDPDSPLARHLNLQDASLAKLPSRELGRFSHSITRYRLSVRVLLAEVASARQGSERAPQPDGDLPVGYHFARDFFRGNRGEAGAPEGTKSLSSLPLTGMAVKALSLLPDNFS